MRTRGTDHQEVGAVNLLNVKLRCITELASASSREVPRD